jgi:mandelate racemase
MPRDTSPTIQEFRVRAVRVPMAEPHQTASGVITESPLVLTDVITDTGISGHSMVFTYTPAALKPTAELIQNCEALAKGEALAPAKIDQKLANRFRLLGTQGLVGMALAAIDMALWDALARVQSLPLVRLLGGVEKPVRPYGAVGYDGVAACAKAAEHWATQGFTGIKAKIGYPTVHEDVAVVRAMRKAAGAATTTRTSRGLKNRRSPTTTPGMRLSRVRHAPPSSAARTGGERWICNTPSKREHRTLSCQT